MKQIMVVGAGSVGGFFGAHLAKNNPNVSFLLRPRTLEAVKRHGLMIKSAKGNFIVHPPAASDPRQLAQPDLIILAVKAYDLDEVMAQLEPVMTDRTVILTLQNGIDTEDRIIARVHRDCVVGGVAFIVAVYALWQVYAAMDVLVTVKWGVAGLALLQITVMGKSFMGTHLEANRVLREVKRIELQLSLLRAAN